MCYVHDLVPSMVRLSNGIGVHFKQDRGEKIVVHFCQDYISYTVNGYKHTLTHYPTIRYIYISSDEFNDMCILDKSSRQKIL